MEAKTKNGRCLTKRSVSALRVRPVSLAGYKSFLVFLSKQKHLIYYIVNGFSLKVYTLYGTLFLSNECTKIKLTP